MRGLGRGRRPGADASRLRPDARCAGFFDSRTASNPGAERSRLVRHSRLRPAQDRPDEPFRRRSRLALPHLVVQADPIDGDQLVAATAKWASETVRSLGEIPVDRGSGDGTPSRGPGADGRRARRAARRRSRPVAEGANLGPGIVRGPERCSPEARRCSATPGPGDRSPRRASALRRAFGDPREPTGTSPLREGTIHLGRLLTWDPLVGLVFGKGQAPAEPAPAARPEPRPPGDLPAARPGPHPPGEFGPHRRVRE